MDFYEHTYRVNEGEYLNRLLVIIVGENLDEKKNGTIATTHFFV